MKTFLIWPCLFLFACTSGDKMDHELTENNDANSDIATASTPQIDDVSDVLTVLHNAGMVHRYDGVAEMEIIFDLHGPDCGAPDCYEHQLILDFPDSKVDRLPDELPFEIHMGGCIDSVFSRSGTFKRQAQTSNFMSYYAEEVNSVLVFTHLEALVFYFEDVAPQTVNAQNIADYLESEEGDSIIPYRNASLYHLERR